MDQVLETLLMILMVTGICLIVFFMWMFFSLYRKISKILDLAGKTSRKAEELSESLLDSVKKPGEKTMGWAEGAFRAIKFFTGYPNFRKKGDQTDE
mgnify:CR=1 FL=1